MHYQVSIVGGGIAGALLALYLGRARISVCLIDRGHPSQDIQKPPEGKTTSLNLSSIESLKQAGVWDFIQKDSQEFEEIHVWDSEGSSSIEFKAHEISKQKLGVIVHNQIILEAIFREIKEYSSIDLIEGESLQSLTSNEDNASIITESGLNISSDLIVGADGSLSVVRNLSNIPIRTWSYHQLAIVSSVITSNPLNETAFQIFTDTGPIALLPLSTKPNLASLIWSTDQIYGEKLLELERDLLMKELRLKTEDRFGALNLDEDIKSFPLNQLHAKKFFKDRSILVGDSAHTIHPLAGQGLNLGIADVRELSELVISKNRYGKNIYDREMLRTYSKRREPESYKMIALMEAFKRGFGSDNPWIKMGRNLAFGFADKAKPLKKRLIKEAAGII